LRKKRRDEEREIKLRKQRAQDRARAHAEAKSTPSSGVGSDTFSDASSGGANPGDFMGGMGGIPGLDKLLEDPEVVELFSDPGMKVFFKYVHMVYRSGTKFGG